ncbi:MAG: hypothetical protein JW882_02585 [Deltaproteobacteria bacterium]|nr:hypothetical protein [Deltaproteobacteria bacterium]
MDIIIDHREKVSGIIDFLEKEGITIEVRNLNFGDYIINHSITIERKTARDFLISIIDGRLFRQIANLKKNCEVPILIIEGNPYKTDLDFDPHAIMGALVSISVIWYIPVILSRSIEDTADKLILMGRQEETYKDVVPLRGGYRPKRLKSKQLYILQGLPKVGPMTAKRLIEHFKCVSKIMNASIDDLTKVEGVGEISAKKIREVLDAEIS